HDMVERRVAGEPLQYVLGAWGFRTLDLLVDRRVLIPRPETETTVEVALEQAKRVDDDPVVVVDLGTGSGAIALSMATEHDTAEVWATDASADALEVARANLTGVGSRVAPRVRLCEGWWFDALPGELRGHVDLVVSNPPYVADNETLPPEVRDWEPLAALFAGPTGLEAIELVLGLARAHDARHAHLAVADGVRQQRGGRERRCRRGAVRRLRLVGVPVGGGVVGVVGGARPDVDEVDLPGSAGDDPRQHRAVDAPGVHGRRRAPVLAAVGGVGELQRDRPGGVAVGVVGLLRPRRVHRARAVDG